MLSFNLKHTCLRVSFSGCKFSFLLRKTSSSFARMSSILWPKQQFLDNNNTQPILFCLQEERACNWKSPDTWIWATSLCSKWCEHMCCCFCFVICDPEQLIWNFPAKSKFLSLYSLCDMDVLGLLFSCFIYSLSYWQIKHLPGYLCECESN